MVDIDWVKLGAPPAKKKKKTKDEQPRTEGGYLINKYRTQGSPTGIYRQSPRGNAPISEKEFNNPMKKSPYTYRGYQVPMYAGSEVVGLPAGSSDELNGKVEGLWRLGNTQQDLDRMLGLKPNRVREWQTRLYKLGWIGKQSITGSSETESYQGVIAFLMQQGNMHGMPWEDVMDLGPQGLNDLGGPTKALGGGPKGPKYGVPSTQTTSSIDHATKGQVRSLLKDALANVLGRGPDPGEFNEFLDMLREKERKNPRVATTTSIDSSATASSDSTVTEGGLAEDDYQQAAERYAEKADPAQAERYKRAGYEQLLDQLIMGG